MTPICWHRSGQTFLALAAERRARALLTPVSRRGRYWKGVLSETAAFELLGKLLSFENLVAVYREVM